MSSGKHKVQFKEEQRYKKPRIRYIMTAVVAFLLLDIAFLLSRVLGEQRAGGEDERTALLIAAAALVLFTGIFIVIFSRLKMITTVTDNGIRVSYPPILRKAKIIRKEEIARFEIREYKAIKEFGGWGIKTRHRLIRTRKYGKAITAYGKTGLQLYLSNGKRLLIGTQRGESLRYAVDKMMASGENDLRRENSATIKT